MGPKRESENSGEGVKHSLPRKGNKFWYLMKIIEYVLIVTCLLLLVLNQYLSDVKDDFTPVQFKSNKTSPDNSKSDVNKTKRSVTLLTFTDLDFNDDVLFRVKRDFKNQTDHHHPETKLSYLLILYPSCTTILMIFTMEIIGLLMKDPLNKFSNLVLIIVGILISVAVFVVSLISAIDTSHISMILVAILSAMHTILIIIDIIFLIMS